MSRVSDGSERMDDWNTQDNTKAPTHPVASTSRSTSAPMMQHDPTLAAAISSLRNELNELREANTTTQARMTDMETRVSTSARLASEDREALSLLSQIF